MKIVNPYIASRFTPNRDLVSQMTKQLADVGIRCVQTWHNERANCPRLEAAERDLRELSCADSLILFTHGCEAVPGGMHFEAGWAWAKGLRFILIGPPVHIFCDLAHEKYALFDQFMESLR